jgi:hypothetical protein
MSGTTEVKAETARRRTGNGGGTTIQSGMVLPLLKLHGDRCAVTGAPRWPGPGVADTN